MSNLMKIFAGSSVPELTEGVARHLNLAMGKASVGRFSDGEIRVEIVENIRGSHVFIMQSTCAPTNDHLMELVIFADAARRASAGSITAVVPYFGYARQDRRVRSARVPITAKVVADMMAAVGITRLITVDLHAEQIQGFFYAPVDNVYATSVMLEEINRQNVQSDCVVVSPDVGGVMRARALAKRLNDADLAIIDKRRPEPNQTEVMNIIGHVEGRHCILVDDMVDTAGTLCAAAAALKYNKAKTVTAYCTHPVLSGAAIENIEKSHLDKLFITDTIPLTDKAKRSSKIVLLSLNKLLAETIRRVDSQKSVSSMFSD